MAAAWATKHSQQAKGRKGDVLHITSTDKMYIRAVVLQLDLLTSPAAAAPSELRSLSTLAS